MEKSKKTNKQNSKLTKKGNKINSYIIYNLQLLHTYIYILYTKQTYREDIRMYITL